MNKKILLSATVTVVTLMLSACSDTPAPATKEETAKKEPAKAPEAVVAKTAYSEAYKLARPWATDLLALSIDSGEVPGIKNEDGKCGQWVIVFVSPSRKEARSFTWSAVDSADKRKGIDVGPVLPWGGATKLSNPFSYSQFVVDSDAAYKTAAEKAGSWLQSHPDMKPSFRLGNASRFTGPVWYIKWGTDKNGYAALVNATTGSIEK